MGTTKAVESVVAGFIERDTAVDHVEIWRREGRNLRLTQAGQHVLAVANQVLPQLDLAEE